jgi:hypothetical protein
MPGYLSRVSIALAAAALSISAANAATLNAGDIAFTAYNADEDGWSIVALANIDANTTLYFTDNEWNGSAIGSGGAFNTGESYQQWTSGGATIAAGTVIRFSSIDTTSLSASIGTLSRATVSGSSNYGISKDADTVYAYRGTSATSPAAFLAAVSSAGSFTSAQGTLTNTGLIEGTSALALDSGTDLGLYTGLRNDQATFAGYRSQVNNEANWSAADGGSYSNVVPNTTAFSVTPVPLPAAVWLMVSGIGALGAAARRRRAV